jgi:hypothetical protein
MSATSLYVSDDYFARVRTRGPSPLQFGAPVFNAKAFTIKLRYELVRLCEILELRREVYGSDAAQADDYPMGHTPPKLRDQHQTARENGIRDHMESITPATPSDDVWETFEGDYDEEPAYYRTQEDGSPLGPYIDDDEAHYHYPEDGVSGFWRDQSASLGALDLSAAMVDAGPSLQNDDEGAQARGVVQHASLPSPTTTPPSSDQQQPDSHPRRKHASLLSPASTPSPSAQQHAGKCPTSEIEDRRQYLVCKCGECSAFLHVRRMEVCQYFIC